jgi:hypothetical protein
MNHELHEPSSPRRAAVLACLLLFAAGATGCSVSFDPQDPNNETLFSCVTDADCLSGFECVVQDGEEVGACRTAQIEGPETDCQDRDNDGFLAGADCAAGIPLDCNDDPNAGGAIVNPGRSESCNGVDDDCDQDIDEDVPATPCPLQFGVCAGSMRTCQGGEYVDCIEAGLYGPDFENVTQDQESCDGIDNNCSGGYRDGASPEDIDTHCTSASGRCIPGITPTQECGTDTGVCERGVRFCQDDGTLTRCLVADFGEDCEEDADCADGAVCISETINYRESLTDGCVLGSEPACSRSVCRSLPGTVSCSGAGDCGDNEICYESACQAIVQGNTDEVCNGEDDDCNGRIDDGADCGRCPFNMVLVDDVPGAVGGICVDLYEASRPDATSTAEGTNALYATSRAGVLPWTNIRDTDAADAACRGTAINNLPINQGGIPGFTPAKRLCTQVELAAICGGTNALPYGGDTPVEGNCNTGAVATTGSFPACETAEGVADLAGNAGELVATPAQGVFGGGGEGRCDYNTTDLSSVPGPTVGFRCCTQPTN